MSQQNPLTLIVPVIKEKNAELFAELMKMRQDQENGNVPGFVKLGNIHYLRWLIIDDKPIRPDDQFAGHPKLVFSSNFDGSVDDHIRSMCTECADLMDSLYQHCEGYPAAGERTPESRVKYFSGFRSNVTAFYIGAPGRSLEQINNEHKLYDFIRSFLNAKDWKGKSAREVHNSIKEAVNAEPEFAWAKKKYKMKDVNWLNMILLGVIMLALLPIIVIWILIVQFGFERKDKYFTLTRSDLNDKTIHDLETYEDLYDQNQFSQLVEMKKGKVRLITYMALMLFARTLISNLFVKGQLMGIPTIHFARWVSFDKNKRVLFFSNFDGSWQQYLGDFIDQSGWGLTGIFSNTTDFPKSRFLFTGGAYDEEHFLAWSRYTQIPTQFWYCAYPGLSIKNVNNNTRIRVGLYQSFSEKKTQKYLDQF